MSRLRTLGFSMALVAAALVGGTIIGSVAAAPSVEAPSGDVTLTAEEAPAREPSAACTTFRAAFAANLGVSEDEVVAAAKAAIGTTVDKAVADGTITAAQAARIKERVARADGDGCRILAGWPGRVARVALRIGQDVRTAAAETLNLTVRELGAELRASGSLEAVANAHDVPYATVSAAALAAVKEDVDAAVADGTISQARADRILARVGERLANGWPVRGR